MSQVGFAITMSAVFDVDFPNSARLERPSVSGTLNDTTGVVALAGEGFIIAPTHCGDYWSTNFEVTFSAVGGDSSNGFSMEYAETGGSQNCGRITIGPMHLGIQR